MDSRRSPLRAPATRGFTVIELVAALVLGGVVLGSLFALMSGTRGAARELEGGLHSLQEELGGLTTLRHELNGCKVLTSAADGSSITYQLPIPAGPEGGYVNDEGERMWGVDDTDGLDQAGSVTLRFERTRTLSEAAAGHDFNHDGDKIDSFDVGRLVRETDAGTRLPFPPITVILPTTNRLGDLDGDGEDDPLFAVDPARRQVTLRMVRIVRESRFRVVEVHGTVARAKEYIPPSTEE